MSVHAPPEDIMEGLASNEVERITKRITSTLEKYPNITVSMLASHVRPYSSLWRVVLEKMVKDGVVIRETGTSLTSKGGVRTTTTHRLAAQGTEAAS